MSLRAKKLVLFINAVLGLALVLVSCGNELTLGLTGLAGFIVLIIADMATNIFDRFITGQPVSELLHSLASLPSEEDHAAEPV